jgi:uncharacterized membrane protein YdbT with pleckstrin-like domain
MAGEIEYQIRDLKRWLRATLVMIVILAAALILPQYSLYILGLLPLVFIVTGYVSVRARTRGRAYQGPDLCVACMTPMKEDDNSCPACGWTFDVA